VLRGELPSGAQAQAFRAALAEHAALPGGSGGAVAALPTGIIGASAAAPVGGDAVARALGRALPRPEALAAAMALLEDAETAALADEQERVVRVLSRVPSACAAVAGVPVPPLDWPYPRRALAALGATRTDELALRALEVLLSLEAEHGLSASTFACRVAASSGAGAGVSLAAAVATLSGHRHGGATSDARALLERAAASGDVAAFVTDLHARKARLAGFGHRIYKVPDPRVPPLREAMRAMGGARLLPVAEALEREGARLWGPKRVFANIDLFGAALLEALGVEPPQYVAAFALGIVPGWLAHWLEQRQTGKLIRPDGEYTGPGPRPLP
jgi:citrate synthase